MIDPSPALQPLGPAEGAQHVRCFAKVGVQSGYSGAQAAQAVMQSAGVQGVRIERHEGFLSVHRTMWAIRPWCGARLWCPSAM
jgi:hypothetical protein